MKKCLMALAAGILLLASIAASASGSLQRKSEDEAQATAESCVLDGANPDGEPVCFENFAAAIYDISGGQIDLPPDATGQDLTQADLNSIVPPEDQPRHARADDWDFVLYGSTIHGILYAREYLSGGSTVFAAPGGNCRDGKVWSYPRLHARLFNDTAESAKAYSGCDGNLFENDEYGGAKRSCESRCDTLGVLKRQTSSVRWKKN